MSNAKYSKLINSSGTYGKDPFGPDCERKELQIEKWEKRSVSYQGLGSKYFNESYFTVGTRDEIKTHAVGNE